MPRRIAYVLVVIAFVSLGSLFAGAGYLTQPMPGGLPFGNALTAVGLVSAATAAYLLGKPGTRLRSASLVAIVVAVAWLPVSILLAGNLALNFGGSQGVLWIGLSIATIVLVLACLLWALASSTFGKSADTSK